MEFIVGNVESIKFDIEIALEEQHGALPLPFPGMDKSVVAVCEFYAKSTCAKGSGCPLRHVRGDRTIVCKHWLRGLCKKGDHCEFLHEYDMTKMPECYFYSRFNACHNKECPFLHIDPESKMKDCPWYDRGFCRHGPSCRHRHVRRVLCMNYLAGFCPTGSECKFMHPRFELPAVDNTPRDPKKLVIVCHFCGDTGHKALFCHKMPQELKDNEIFLSKMEGLNIIIEPKPADYLGSLNSSVFSRNSRTLLLTQSGEESTPRGPLLKGLKPLEEVTCYKCGCKGHYANKCPKGHLAFLTLSQHQLQQQKAQ